MQAAVSAAAAAFPTWSTSGIQARHDALDKIGNEILARKDELGDLLAREEARPAPKPSAKSRARARSLNFLRVNACAWPARPCHQCARSRRGNYARAHRRSWPDHALEFSHCHSSLENRAGTGFWQLRGLQATDLVPASAWALAEIIHRCGIPAGVFNLVMGTGRVIGQTLVQHPDVAAISFTGSVSVGQSIAQACVANGKKVQPRWAARTRKSFSTTPTWPRL